MDDEEVCYLCGSKIDITDDHIPPEGFFPDPKPQNLIKVKSCYKCNHSFHLDDEVFRIFASSQVNRSKSGEWIWKNKVIGSSFKRSPKLKENVIKNLIPLKKDSESDLVTWGLQFPIERGEKFLVRLTKGLIKFYYPGVDYSRSNFKITHLIPSQQMIDNTLSKMIYDERGDSVFRTWHAFISNDKAASLWIHVFYDALMFMVEVDLD